MKDWEIFEKDTTKPEYIFFVRDNKYEKSDDWWWLTIKLYEIWNIIVSVLNFRPRQWYNHHWGKIDWKNNQGLTFLPSKSCVTIANTLSTLDASANVTNPKPL